MKKKLQERLIDLEKQLHNNTLNHNALLGARQEVFELLHALNEDEKKKEESEAQIVNEHGCN